MPDTFTFEEAQPETFSFAEAGGEKEIPDWMKGGGTPAAMTPPMGAVSLTAPSPRQLVELGKRGVFTQPAFQLPSAEIKPDDSFAGAVGKESYNILKSVPEFFTSPLGATTAMTGGLSRLGQAIIKLGFTADMAKQLGETVLSTYRDWDKMTSAQKGKALVDLAGTGTLGFLLGKSFVKDVPMLGKRGRAIDALAEQMANENISPALPTPTPERRLGLGPVPTTPFEQPGIVELADAALRERQQLVRPAGEQGQPALGALRIAVGGEPRIVTPELPPAPAVRIPGGGEAPYGKVSYMRRMEEPILAKAGETLPTAAAEVEKGVTANAPEERNVQEGVLGERPGDDAQRPPAETGVSGGVRPTTPVTAEEVSRPESEQGRLLLEHGELTKQFDGIVEQIKRGDLSGVGRVTEIQDRLKAIEDQLPERPELVDQNRKSSPAKYYGTANGVRQYNLTADIVNPKTGRVEHPKNSSVAETTLDKYGVPKETKTEPPLREQGAAPQTTAPTVAAPEGEPVALVSAGAPPGISKPTTPVEKAQGPVEKAAAQGQTLVAGTALEKWANDQLKGGGTHLGPDVLAAYLVKGVGLMERGVIKFADWAQRMIAEHGQSITPKLRELYAEAKAAFERRAGSPAYQPARDIFERQRATAQPAQPAVAATTTQATTPATPRRAVTSGLDDIYKIFEAEKPQRTPIRRTASNIIEAVRTGFSSKFRPINKLAEDIAKAYGIAKQDIAGIFEQLKGSRGKGEADVYRFDRAVSDLVGKDTKDFNAYMFLNRSLDRLRADLRDVQAAQAGAPVAKLNRRSVAGYTIPELEAKLATLEAKLGPENLARFREAATRYQAAMDSALRLQVESGRMSQEVYNAIKADNQFYAPFKVMKWLEEGMRPEGSGRKVDTLADYTKAMTGIEDPNFKLGDMLSAARQNLLISRILADKATAMRKVADLATQDTQAQFIKKLGPKEEPRAGWKTVNVFENGKPVKYATNPEVVKAIELFGDRTGGFISGVLQAASIPFKAGATALNIPFQVSNLLADVPRQALVSRYGIRGVSDLIRYPLDLLASLLWSIMGDVFGRKNKLFLDFLDSGAAATTVQESLTPEALRFRDPATMSKAKRVALNILYSPAEFAAAIESTSKIMGIKRAMRFEGVTSGADLAKRIPAAVTEIRRFSGSPDFGRQGSWTETARLNLLYMFLNARIQGAVADIGRLAGRDGAKRAAITWMRLGTAIGTPTVMLYALNNSPEHRDDYAKRPVYEKENYWLIPKGSYVTNEQGEKVRDYWRVPKRESSKWIANMVESGLNFAQKRDPQALGQFLVNTLEDISPVNIQGRTAQERIESVGASLNPVIKAPLEVATQRDMFRHRPLIPDTMKKASPELQYTDRTPEAFKVLANKMPDVAPEFLRSPIMLENMTRNLTAGLITQFLPGKPVEGRSRLANIPLLQRFQAIPYTDNAAFTEEMRQMDRESADEYLTRHRKATDMLRDGKDKSLPDILRATKDPKIMQQVVDLWVARKNGVTQQDRQLIGLPPKQRAELLAKRLKSMTPEQKKAAILDWSKKRVLTKAVFLELSEALP